MKVCCAEYFAAMLSCLLLVFKIVDYSSQIKISIGTYYEVTNLQKHEDQRAKLEEYQTFIGNINVRMICILLK